MTLQEIIHRLQAFWSRQGCLVLQPYDLEKGASTFNPASFLRVLGPEPWASANVEPCRRPKDGRYGENPNRVQQYYQFQVILKPAPADIQDRYRRSLAEIGLKVSEHDVRFTEDDWESPTLGAAGLGWQVWLDGLEITQFTYFQQMGGVELNPVSVEITYGLERIAMFLQRVDSIFDLEWGAGVRYGALFRDNEVQWSQYNFAASNADALFELFGVYEQETQRLLEVGLVLPAYDHLVRSSHLFNLLEARGSISVTERVGYITRLRNLAKACAQAYLKHREELGFPLHQQAWRPLEPAAAGRPAARRRVSPGTRAAARTRRPRPRARGAEKSRRNT